MADQKVSDLPSLNGADVDPADLLYIVDSSAGTAGSKKITVGQFQIAPFSGSTADTVLYLNGSKVLSSSSALTFDGTNFATTGTATATKFIPTGNVTAGNGMYLPAANNLAWSINGSEQMRLTSTGLGIGTSSPGTKLHVTGSNGLFVQFLNSQNNTGEGIVFGSGTNLGRISTNGASTAMAFEINAVEKARLDSSGNLGLGVTPSGYLANKFVINTGTDSSNGITIASATNRNGSIWFADGTTGNQAYRGGVDYQHTTDTLYLYSGGQGNFQLDSSGNLGLGVTPSAWASGRKVLQVSAGSAGAFLGSGSVAQALLGANGYSDGSTYRYVANGAATLFEQGAGAYYWYTAPSGTAGNAITFTQALTLDASGNLGLGRTATAVSAYRMLEVDGTTGGYIRQYAGGTLTGYWYSTSTESGIGSKTSAPFLFYTNDTERARITSGGALLVGTTSQIGRFAVNGAATSDPLVSFYSSTAGDVGQPGLIIGKQDNNTTTSQIILRATILSSGAGAGQINMNGANTLAFGTYSDARLKENITDLPSQLANIMALRPVEFDYIESEGGGHQIGFIAQEMQQVYPDAVGKREDGMLTVSAWSKTEARLVKAIQEQQAIITALTARVAALEAKP